MKFLEIVKKKKFMKNETARGLRHDGFSKVSNKHLIETSSAYNYAYRHTIGGFGWKMESHNLKVIKLDSVERENTTILYAAYPNVNWGIGHFRSWNAQIVESTLTKEWENAILRGA